MKLKIQTWLNNPILRTIWEEVVDFSEAKNIVKDMKKFLEKSEDWVWVAAPQLWISKRIFLACIEEDEEWNVKKNNITAFINPKILKFSDKKCVWQEWCLSIPWVFWDVERSKEIEVEYQNLKWEIIKKKLWWFWAIVFQHEFDHINWKLFFDRIINWEFVMDEWITEKDLNKLDIFI